MGAGAPRLGRDGLGIVRIWICDASPVASGRCSLWLWRNPANPTGGSGLVGMMGTGGTPSLPWNGRSRTQWPRAPGHPLITNCPSVVCCSALLRWSSSILPGGIRKDSVSSIQVFPINLETVGWAPQNCRNSKTGRKSVFSVSAFSGLNLARRVVLRVDP